MPYHKNINKILLFALYQNKKLSTYKISRILGCSPSFIRNSLVRNKIPIISNSQRFIGVPRGPHSKESRLKMAISKLGDNNPAKRIEVRAKISKANKGRKFSKETRENMSKAQKGRVIKWGAKISDAKKKWYASRQGQEFIKKLRKRIGSDNPMFGKSVEIKNRHWVNLWDESRKQELINIFRKKRMNQRFPSKATLIEKLIEKELRKRKIHFVMHYPILDICQPDIVILDNKLAVQCDGDWWHANPKFYDRKSLSEIQLNNIKRDRRQDNILINKGWHVMRFWESEIKKDAAGCVNRIEGFLKQKPR